MTHREIQSAAKEPASTRRAHKAGLRLPAVVCALITVVAASLVYGHVKYKDVVDAETLGLVFLGIVPWLLPYLHITEIEAAGLKLTLGELTQKVQGLQIHLTQTQEIATDTQSMLINGVGKRALAPRFSRPSSGPVQLTYRKNPPSFDSDDVVGPGTTSRDFEVRGIVDKIDDSAGGAPSSGHLAYVNLDDTDPNKNKFGGKPEENGRRLQAKVEPIPGDSETFRVRATVTSTQPDKPLRDGDEVTFYLHPTFARDVVKVLSADGAATIERLAWGAFTIGVEMDAGRTKLELDLAELPDAPALFRSR